MTPIIATSLLILFVLIGAILFLAMAGMAIIYCLGSNQSPKSQRIILGILGVTMFREFICLCIFLVKNGWPL